MSLSIRKKILSSESVLFLVFFCNSTSAFTSQLLNSTHSLNMELFFQSLLTHHGDEFLTLLLAQ